MYFLQLVAVMVVVVRVMVKDEGAGKMEEEVIVKVVQVVVRVMVKDAGAGEMEEGVIVKKVVGVVRVSGEGKERWVMMGEREADKKN